MDECEELPSSFIDLKYTDLQKWAKKFGIKANMKAQKLIDALMQYVASNDHVADNCRKASEPVYSKYENRRDKIENEGGDELESKIIFSNDKDESGEIEFTKSMFEEMEQDVIGKCGSGIFAGIQEKGILEDHIAQAEHFSMNLPSNCNVGETDVASDWLNKDQNNTLTGGQKSSAAIHKTHIPRLNRSQQNQGSPIKPFSAQYWAKLHKRQFDQMDSLDAYMKKKTKRALSLLSPNRPNSTLVKHSKGEIQKKEVIETEKNPPAFIPTVFTTTKMNMNFSEMQDKARKDVLSPNVKHSSYESARKSLGTPFAAAATENVNSNMKPKFDLHASLARPITWKPYIGKLRDTYARNLHCDVKKVQVKSRDDRRKEINDARVMKRIEKQYTQRGITVNK